MKALVLVLSLMLPLALHAEELSPTAASTDAPAAVTVAARTWGLTFDPISWGFGGGYYTTGWTLEDAYWEHFSMVSRLDMNLGGTGGANVQRDGWGFHSWFSARIGSRWRPWNKKSLAGPYLGLGLSKYLGAYEHYDVNSSQGSSFAIYQDLDIYSELGWQWVRKNGFLIGVKVTVPLFADWWLGSGTVAERFTTVSMTWGFTW